MIDNPGTEIAEGTVDGDFPCRKCAYNLRGLPKNGLCPECGTPVEISIGTDLLRYSDPTYLLSMRRGIHLIFAGVVGLIVIGILRIFMFRTAGTMYIGSLLQLAGSGLMIAGSWLLTNPDPSGIGESRYGTIRKLIRVCLIIGVSDDIIQTALSLAMLPTSAVYGLQFVAMLAQAATLVGELALLEYLSRLAARLPDLAMQIKSKSLMKGIGICNGILIASVLPLRFLGGSMGAGVAFVGCFMLIVGLFLLVLYIRFLGLLAEFAGRLKLIAEQSQQLWAAAKLNAQPDGAPTPPVLPTEQ